MGENILKWCDGQGFNFQNKQLIQLNNNKKTQLNNGQKT